ncbi:MAG: hypothetical protein IT265_07045 [Saprospiraceae bacterium]|nr:hypothetical protein [Saprospiraceae bacterium]
MITEIIAYAPKGFSKDVAFKDGRILVDAIKSKAGIPFNIIELDANTLDYYKNTYDDIKEFPVIMIWLQERSNANAGSPDYSFYLSTDIDRQYAKNWFNNYYKNPDGSPVPTTTRFICNDGGKIITLKKGDVGFDTAFDDAGQAQASCKAAEKKSFFSPLVLAAIGLGAFIFFRK